MTKEYVIKKKNPSGLTSNSTRYQLTIGFWIKRRYRYFLALLSFSGNVHMMGYLNLLRVRLDRIYFAETEN